ncbi:thiamine-phosphate kinase [Stenotrophomonas sp. MMGLT7]|uniref:thiamine-phosphate kinase n=1 Tax=Stenotrophomonas sp. MMGLT7 TaxID=2901227 RepID=UPI001E4DA2A2|nr:thiamine-phosphate kinase [Stenotrophomonas sp. MMGLT7]MCD7098299.1 thiamine-phosphate kinase [Stenotrophomonas sp. MMGLT7]
MAEFDLIARIQARSRARADIALGVGDDAALLLPPDGQALAVTVDTLNSGMHFPAEALPADIGWKSLAVNLSDLAAMGAQPLWCTLSLALPRADVAWLDAFLDGFLALADGAGIALVGGDTTQIQGPPSISVTAMGAVPPGQALRRDGAQAGDDIWVTGTPGDAFVALTLWRQGRLDVTVPGPSADLESVRQRLLRPTPRLAAGLALRGLAHACVDISDGLLGDLGHICERSAVGARLRLDAVPVPAAQRRLAVAEDPYAAVLAGGDDYELCFTAAPAQRDAIAAALLAAGTEGSRIGSIVAGDGVEVVDALGHPWRPPHAAFQHFSADS